MIKEIVELLQKLNGEQLEYLKHLIVEFYFTD